MAKAPSLRDYQEHYKSESYNFFKQSSNQYLLLVMPTGTGKTTLFSSMTFDFVKEYHKTFLVVHRIELVDQIVARLADFGIRAGVIAGGYPLALELPVQVGMIQSLSDELNWIPDYVIIDECHHSPAGTYTRIWERFPRAKILGVTATPVRTDNKGFDDLYDTMLNLYPMSWFFERNHLVTPKHYICTNFSPPITTSLSSGIEYDYIEMAKQLRADKQIADVINSYRVYSPGRRAVVFAVNVDHSKDIMTRFNKAGIPADHIDGSLDKNDRKRIIKEFSEGKIKVLCNYDIVSEGFDVPAIETVILARRSKSLSWYMQSVGRCLRPAEGKANGYVLDCANAWLEFGPAGMDYDWDIRGGDKQILESATKSRLHFINKKNKLESLISNPEEIIGADLIEMCNKMKRLAEFEFYVADERKKKDRNFTRAVLKYHAYLQFQGYEMTNYEADYCRIILEQEREYVPQSFWQDLVSTTVNPY